MLQPRLYFTNAIILLIGLGSSVLTYLTAANDARSVYGYKIVGGNAYLITPEKFKEYVHDLKFIGNNAAVFADEFSRWFIGLWHGKPLAFTVAAIISFYPLEFSLLPEPHHPM